MDDGSIGRLLVASLHQSIADELPTRLEFYESWLSPEGLRDGRIGLAPLAAVLSFLRQEGGGAYPRVTARAGAHSAEWLVDALNPTQRKVALYRNVRAYHLTQSGDSAQVLRQAEDLMVAKGIVKKGDMIVVTWGEPMGQVGGTNALKIVRVGELD